MPGCVYRCPFGNGNGVLVCNPVQSQRQEGSQCVPTAAKKSAALEVPVGHCSVGVLGN